MTPRPRCRHPGCLALAAIRSVHCRYHRDAINAAIERAAQAAMAERAETRRKKRLSLALALVKRNGYTVVKSTQPEAFPS